MRHPRRERLAAVLGERQGSGYLLTTRLVLTAAHVVGSASRPRVIVPGAREPVPCQVVWSREDERCDVALLLAESSLFSALDLHGDLAWCWTDSLSPWPDAACLGFPHVERGPAGELESHQLLGVLNPGTGLLRGYSVLESRSGAPDGDSPWAGLSGAPVFLHGRIAGVVRSDPFGWRHGRVVLTPSKTLLSDLSFSNVCRSHEHPLTAVELETPSSDGPEGLEQALRDLTVRQFGSLHIIGGGLAEGSWALDTSYLSLELVERRSGKAPAAAPGYDPRQDQPLHQRTADALAGRRRVLIQGPAGSGKSTLLQWLAAGAARKQLPSHLTDWNDAVPLLLRLRSLIREAELPGPGDFLKVVARPLSGHEHAHGWADRQLRAGRILLLVDGVDEVPEADRERVREWLVDLIDTFPNNHVVVTTRPSAVRGGWLSALGFAEFEIQPMSREDVSAFITIWHESASLTADEGEREQLIGWEQRLQQAVLANPDLGRLATNPLLCALSCALNRERLGYLPERRIELYSAAMEMLTHRRDRERGIASSPQVELTQPQQQRLLQKLAYWLTINGALEISTDRAAKIIGEALPGLRRAKGTPDQVLRHLVLRSGMLRKPTADTVDFVHRTFQDYLAAQAAVDDEMLGVLIRNAHDDQWGDVLRMAVAHARPQECRRVLEGLLDRAEQDPTSRDRLRVVAATCLDYATDLDPEVEERVQQAVAALIPPRSQEAELALCAVGPSVLNLLPGPAGLTDGEAEAVVRIATALGSNRAIPLLAQYTQHGSLEVKLQLARRWPEFDPLSYARDVIARLPAGGTPQLRIRSREQIDALRVVEGMRSLYCEGDFTNADLDALPWDRVCDLTINGSPHPLDLAPLASAPGLTHLGLVDCPGSLDLSVLAGRRLDYLHIRDCPELGPIQAVADMESLVGLFYMQPRIDCRLRLPKGVEQLHLAGASWPESFGASAETLLELMVQSAIFTSRRRELIDDLPSLRKVTVLSEDLDRLSRTAPMNRLTHLTLRDPYRLSGLRHVPLRFPSLQQLTIDFTYGRSSERLDLHALRDMHGCRLAVVQPKETRRPDGVELLDHLQFHDGTGVLSGVIP